MDVDRPLKFEPRSFLRALISVATGGRIGFARCFAGSFARLLCASREDVERNLVESIAKRPRQSLSNVTGDSRKSIVQPLFSVSCRRKSRSDPAYVHPGRSLSPMKNTEGPGQKEPFYPSTQKGISLTTLSHLLKKTWDDVRADYGRDEDGKREKKVEKREGTRGRDTNSRDRLMLAERKAERKEVLP